MKIIVLDNYDAMSSHVADIFRDRINAQPDCVLGLATGGTPLGLYRTLVSYHKQGLDMSHVKTFNLDEYVGLPADHPASYRYYMDENLFSKVNVLPENIHVPDGTADDVEQECERYEQSIRAAGGIDLQILGIGHNGHIGFNEPGTEFGTPTHVVELAESTREANARFFSSLDEVPTKAISMGIKPIMQARQLILLANGSDKADAVKKAVDGAVTTDVPASVLQLHPNVLIVVDQDAASLL